VSIFQTAALASGSKGNSFLVRTKETKLLFDAGLSWKQTENALLQLSLAPGRVEGIVISHEHSDHVRNVGVLARKLKVPIFVTEPTFHASEKYFQNIPSEVIFFRPGDYLEIGDLVVHPFPSSHDAVDACNFTIKKADFDGRKLAIATDLGYSTKLFLQEISNVTTIILESNHDVSMLMDGEYPWHLKQRIKSINGHLSNDQAVGVMSQIAHEQLNNVILAHLSEENNNPQKALQTMTQYLSSINAQTKVYLSRQDKCTPLVNV